MDYLYFSTVINCLCDHLEGFTIVHHHEIGEALCEDLGKPGLWYEKKSENRASSHRSGLSIALLGRNYQYLGR